jgi:transposase-like protein
MDETYIKVGGRWVYVYRAVDKVGWTVDFVLSRNRDVNAAKAFLRSAMKKTRKPAKTTLDAYAASHRAVREMAARATEPILEQSWVSDDRSNFGTLAVSPGRWHDVRSKFLKPNQCLSVSLCADTHFALFDI